METSKRKSFSVRIYLQDGHADGVKIISKSKWSGRGLVIPRTALAQEKDREELQAPVMNRLQGNLRTLREKVAGTPAPDPPAFRLRKQKNIYLRF